MKPEVYPCLQDEWARVTFVDYSVPLEDLGNSWVLVFRLENIVWCIVYRTQMFHSAVIPFGKANDWKCSYYHLNYLWNLMSSYYLCFVVCVKRGVPGTQGDDGGTKGLFSIPQFSAAYHK